MDFRFDIVVEYAPFFLKGVLWTIGLSLVGIVFGTVLGLVIGLGKMVQNRFIRLPFDWYVHFFRGTPLFVQILLIHFGVMPIFTSQPNPLVSGAISLSLNAAAYIAEIFRSRHSIDRSWSNGSSSLARYDTCTSDALHHFTASD